MDSKVVRSVSSLGTRLCVSLWVTLHQHLGHPGRSDGWMRGWMEGWVEGWMQGWVDGRAGGWMGGWMDY